MTKFVPAGPPRYVHQRRGLNKILRTKGVTALLFEPGTGKTAVALDYMSILAMKLPEQEARVLVVCPLAAMDTWALQAEEYVAEGVQYWVEVLGGSVKERAGALASRGGRQFKKDLAPVPKRYREYPDRAAYWWRSYTLSTNTNLTLADGPGALDQTQPRMVVQVINYDTLSSRRSVGSKTMADVLVAAVERFDPHLVVADEAHRLKSKSSNVSRLMSRIGDRVPRRVALTGTVIPHSPLDVFAQWRFLAPTAFGKVRVDGTRTQATFKGFRDRYAQMGGYMGREVRGFKNLEDMQRVMARNAVVARKEDALDLPLTTDVVVPVRLSTAESVAYAEMKKKLTTTLADGQKATVPNRLAQLMRLRQITSGHLPDDSGTVQKIGSSKVDVMASLVLDTLTDVQRVVVFCEFTHEIEALSEALSRDREVMKISGATPTDKRLQYRQRFGSDAPEKIVLVAQIRTMSLAVNELVTASHAIFGSLSQRRDDLIQARDRLNRIGQTRPVTYYYALAPNTVDEVIYAAHNERTDLETALLRHLREEN